MYTSQTFNENGQYCILEQSFPKEQLNKSRVAYMYLEPLTQLCTVSMIKIKMSLTTVLDISVCVFP